MKNFLPGEKVFVACKVTLESNWVVVTATIGWTNEFLDGYHMVRCEHSSEPIFARRDRVFSSYEDAKNCAAVINVMGV